MQTVTVRPAGATRRASAAVPALCLTTFAAVWIALAIAPIFREDWQLENLLTIVGVPVAALTYRDFGSPISPTHRRRSF